jgi:hypothetical protein
MWSDQLVNRSIEASPERGRQSYLMQWLDLEGIRSASYPHAIHPLPVWVSAFKRSRSVRVTIPSTVIPSFVLLFSLLGCSGGAPSCGVDSSTWLSKHISAATWHNIHAGSTGGNVNIRILRRPMTCLYSVMDEGPNIRRRCDMCIAGAADGGSVLSCWGHIITQG